MSLWAIVAAQRMNSEHTGGLPSQQGTALAAALALAAIAMAALH